MVRCGAALALAMPLAASVALASNPTVSIDDATTCADGSEFCYRPASLTVDAGTTVTVTNGSMASHSLTRCTVSACGSGNTGSGSQSFDTGVLSSGSSASITLNQPGTYVYYCTVHGYSVMHGSFTVNAAAMPTPSAGASPSAAPTATASASSSPSRSSAAAAATAPPVPATGAGVDLRVGTMLLAAGTLTLVAAVRRRR
jgi:plastocyanin